MISKNFISKLLLVILLAGCITGLVIVTMHQCNDKEGYEARKAVNAANTNYKREGNGMYPIGKKACNKVDKTWLENATPEDIQNLTVQKNGEYYMCNKSGPLSISKPLTKNMLHLGVM